MSPADEKRPLTYYSESGFAGRSIFFGVILSALTFWLTDASNWQAWVVTLICLVCFTAMSLQQATLIEYGVMLIIIAIIIGLASTTEYFNFHWSILLVSTIAGLNGMGGKESRDRHQFRTVYGDEAYLEKYGTD